MSAIGQIEVMRAIHPEISERELQGIHEFVFKKYGANTLVIPQSSVRCPWLCPSLHQYL